MAIKASRVIKEYPQYYDEEALKHVSMGEDMLDFPGLTSTLTRDQSKLINEAPKPKIIIAGSGMMNGGRILHHLVRYLGDANSTVLIIGYQAEGTLGRRLYRGDKSVTVLGEHIQVKATISSIGAYSAHADQNKLIRWVGGCMPLPKHVYCTHGDEGAAQALATRLKHDLGVHADVPRFGDTITV
jgi:metallo-beta-lactamase family protein